MNFSDSYVIFSPKKGMEKFFTLSYIVSLVCNAFTLILYEFLGKCGEEGFSFMAFGLASTFSIFCEIIFAVLNMWGIASKDSRRNSFLRTVPDMEKIIKNALICDEIKRIVLCVMTCGISCMITVVIGFYEVKNIILAYIYQAALMYIIITVGGYIIKRVKKGNTQTAFILEYIWLIVSNLGNILTSYIISGLAGFPASVMVIIAIYAAAAMLGTLCFRAVLKCSLSSRYADKEIKEGT